MTDVQAPAPRVVSAQPIKSKRFRLHDDWKWILARSWSLRFIFFAFLLSGLEVALPLVSSLQGLPFYPILIGLVVGAAFVARLVAQKKEDDSGK